VCSYSCVDIAIDYDGKCVVVWEQEENGYSKIYAQRFKSDRSPIGSNFRVSTQQDTFDHIFPSVALYKGKIYTSWSHARYGPTYPIWANIIDFDDPPTSVKDHRTINSPISFYLFQNYPNPFNTMTTIRYEVSQRSHVQLSIYNLLGEKVIKIVNKEMMSGIHNVKWNGEDFRGCDISTGIYLLRLTVDGNYQTRKLLVVK
jgi:hypothetical protein